jgi:hypothetical protein
MEKSYLVLCVLTAVTGETRAQETRVRPVPNTCAGVVKHQGDVIEGAKLHFVWLAHPELPRSLQFAIDAKPTRRLAAKSKARGRFRVGLPHPGPFAVFARHGNLRSPISFPVFAGDYLTLRVEPIRHISGTVIDAQGKPVAGARVAKHRGASWAGYLRLSQHPGMVEVVLSAADGSFRLPVWALSPRPTMEPRSLWAWTDSVASKGTFYFNTGQSDGEIRLQLTRHIELKGIIHTHDNQPVAGAHVWDPLVTGRGVKTDESGQFRLVGARAHHHIVHARGHRRSEVPSAGNVNLSPGLRLSMQLVHDRIALQGRRVVLAAPVGQTGHLPWIRRIGADGKLVLDSVTAKLPLSGFLEYEGRFVRFLSCVPTRNRDFGKIRVTVDRTLHGRILNAERRPVVAAEVLLQPQLTDAEYALLGSPSNPTRQNLSRMAYTDRAGRFRFDQVMAGAMLLGIKAGRDGIHTMRIAAGHSGATNITIPKGQPVAGRVVLPGGKPAAHAVIQYIVRCGGDVPRFTKRYGLCYLYLAADAEGRFAIRGLPKHSAFTCYALHSENGVGYRSLQSGSLAAGKPLEIVHQLVLHPARN